MGLARLVREHGEARARLDERAGHERVLPEHRRTDREHQVVAAQGVAQPVAGRRQVPGEQLVILREAGPGTEALLVDGRPEPLGQRHQGRPGVGVVGAGAGDQRGTLGAPHQGGELLDQRGVRGVCAHDAGRRGELVQPARRREPVVHRHDHQGRPAPGDGLVVGAPDGPRHVLRAHR